MKAIFFQQRLVWLPKMWLVIAFLFTTVTIVLLGVKYSALYLAVTEPEHGEYLIVEGWQDEDSLSQSLMLFESGSYQHLITTGGPDTSQLNPEYKTYAEKSAAFLLAHGIEPSKLTVVAAPASAQNRTFLSAVMVREWMADQNMMNITLDVYSQGVHARRTHKLFKMAFGKSVDIGVFASKSTRYELDTWWKTSDGAKSVITELVGMAWITCCFNPGKQGSHEEKWGLERGA